MTIRGTLLLAVLAGGGACAQQRRSAGPSYHPMAPQTQRPQSFQRPQAGQGFGGVRTGVPQQQTAMLRPNPYGGMRQAGGQAPAPVVRQAPPASPQTQRPAPVERRAPSPRSAPAAANGQHLAEWMNQHRDQSLAQQQNALEREPGFHQLPQNTQQRYRNLLGRLNAMSPQERQRWTQHTEAMERLNPGQRAQVRSAMQQLGSLPPDQRTAVARSFRQLRQMPPEQRAAALNSDRYQQMNDAQKATLNNLMRIEPMLPPE